MKLIRWIFFGIILALAPLAIRFLSNWLQFGDFKVEDVLSNGDLCIIVTVMCGAALGEVLGSDGNLKALKVVVGGCVLILLIASACTYGFAGMLESMHATGGKERILAWSEYMFVAGVLFSTCCVWLSED